MRSLFVASLLAISTLDHPVILSFCFLLIRIVPPVWMVRRRNRGFAVSNSDKCHRHNCRRFFELEFSCRANVQKESSPRPTKNSRANRAPLRFCWYFTDNDSRLSLVASASAMCGLRPFGESRWWVPVFEIDQLESGPY